MAQFILSLLLVICFASNIAAQPRVVGTHHFGDGHFFDVYSTNDGGFAACGYHDARWWIVKTDSTFQTEWSQTYQGNNLLTIVELDDSGFLAGGQGAWQGNYTTFGAIRTDENGNVRWSRTYGAGECDAVLELKNGNCLLVGFIPGHALPAIYGHLIMINADGGVVGVIPLGE